MFARILFRQFPANSGSGQTALDKKNRITTKLAGQRPALPRSVTSVKAEYRLRAAAGYIRTIDSPEATKKYESFFLFPALKHMGPRVGRRYHIKRFSM